MEQGNALILGRDLVSARRVPHGRRWTPSAGLKEGMLSQAWNGEDGWSAPASLRLARVPGGDSDKDGKFRRNPIFSTAFILPTFTHAKGLHKSALRNILMFGDDGISGLKNDPDSRSR